MPLHVGAIARHSARRLALIAMGLLGTTSVMAGAPPSSARIEGVQVQVQQPAGQIAGSPARQVMRSGDVALQQADLRAMLDTLHALDFFHLPDRMTARTSVAQREGGTGQTQVLRMSDEPATRVCVLRGTPAYEKCVSFTASAGPAALVQWAEQVLTHAVSR
jgi:hypothetical protein